MNTLNTYSFDDWADIVVQHDEKKVVEAIAPLFEWLTELHAKDKAHGNIQPCNLVVSLHNHINRTHFEASATPNMVCNSVYAPPEAYDDPRPAPTVQGDVYAVSAVLYRAVIGMTPVRASSRKARKCDPLLMSKDVSAAMAQALSKGLALQPELRPASIMELLDLLRSPAPTLAAPIPETPEAQPGSSTDVSIPTQPQPTPPPASPQPPLPPSPTIAKRLSINLTVGRSFTIPVTDLLKDPGAWVIRFANAEELGLPFDENRNALVGSPKVPGEQQLHIELTHPDSAGRPPLKQTIAVTVNPDPDSLWRNLPSNEKDPYFKPDTDHAETATPHARVFAASQRGRSHAHEGLFRDDDFRLCFDESSEWHLLAAADGAGSAKFSRRGSQIACAQALDFMSQWLMTQRASLDAAVQSYADKVGDHLLRSAAYAWLGGAAFAARKAIQLEAEKRDPPAALRDYHTTLLLAVAKLTPAGWVIASFSIGDGGIALRRVDGEPLSLCTPDSGDYGGQTVFLTASNVLSNADLIMQRIHTAIEPNLSALVLMTDGVTDPKFPTEVSLGDAAVWKLFWDELTSAVKFKSGNGAISAQLLKWLSFRSPGNHDDRTIVLLMPRTESENVSSQLENAPTPKGLPSL